LLYHFSDLVLDSSRRELRRRKQQILPEPQVFDLLEFLICARDRVVSREQLLDAVWCGRTTPRCPRVNAARTAVGDDGKAQRSIRTLPRKGIRFVGEVREAPDSAAAAPVPDPTDPAEPEKPSIAVLPFANMSGDPEQKTSSRRCPAQRAVRHRPQLFLPLQGQARRHPQGSGVSLTSPMCSKVASAAAAAACGSRDN
jgi:DNA-binding winged helix-turn-helix (wHTH) protein